MSSSRSNRSLISRISMKLELPLKVAVTMYRPPGNSATNCSTSSLMLSHSQLLAELIKEYQLIREVDEILRHIYAPASEYIQPFLHANNVDDWSFYKIVKEGSSEVLFRYATNIVEQTYHVSDLQLRYPDETRKTEMRLHELNRSTWAKDVEPPGRVPSSKPLELMTSRNLLHAEQVRMSSQAHSARVWIHCRPR